MINVTNDQMLGLMTLLVSLAGILNTKKEAEEPLLWMLIFFFSIIVVYDVHEGLQSINAYWWLSPDHIREWLAAGHEVAP